MSRGKYLSLREARKKKQFERFAKEHPSEGDAEKLDSVLGAMASKKPESDDQTSQSDSSED
jgi:hypothetical protein